MADELKNFCCYRIKEINKEKGWNLSSHDIKELLEEILPHVIASISKIPEKEKIKGTDYDNKQLIEMIRVIITNYYLDSPDIKALNFDDYSVQRKYHNYFKRVILKKYRDCLPKVMSVDDLTQASWINILCGLKKGKFHFRSRFTTWSYRVIFGTWRDFIKKPVEKITHIPIDNKSANGEGNTISPDKLIDPNSNFSDNVEKENLLKLVRKALEEAIKQTRNRARNKKIMDMWKEDRTHKEIAEKLDMPINTVSTSINRIQKEWKKILSDSRLSEDV
jgi:RNA polymerase sigma factor (sigma-70 family)